MWPFAFANRQLMMTRICEAIQAVKPEADFEPMINIAHNYAAWENHFDQDVIVHRKRSYALPMKVRLVLSPGSMGTKSYIVEGLGNPESFEKLFAWCRPIDGTKGCLSPFVTG